MQSVVYLSAHLRIALVVSPDVIVTASTLATPTAHTHTP